MIDRKNYEEFFVLYIDNELPVTMRDAVEKFIADNPDLKEELETLLQCRVEPDYHTFPETHTLLQFEESFLSYIDGELPEHDRQTVEELIQQYPDKAADLRRLQQTVSQPDPDIIFPHKEQLYKKERRVVLMPWLKAGIAAAILGALALLLLPPAHQHPPTVAVKNISEPVTPPTPTALYPEKDTVSTAKIAIVPKGSVTKPTSPARTPAVAQPQPIAKTTISPQPDHRPVSPVDTVSRQQAPVIAVVPHDGAIRHNEAAGHDEVMPDKKSEPVINAVVVNIPKEQSSFATQALLKEQEQDQTNNMVADEGTPRGKNKLRGLFRRVTRTLGKTADRDADGQRQVLISAFQVDLK